MNDDDEYLKETVAPGVFSPWQEVEVEIYDFTDLGIKVSVNNEYVGLVYGNEVYADYHVGQILKGYVKFVRDDGKIDISMQPQPSKHVASITDTILQHLEAAGGRSRFNDKSSPEAIRNEFKISKKVFKQAIGRLYKQKKILITDQGIELVK